MINSENTLKRTDSIHENYENAVLSISFSIIHIRTKWYTVFYDTIINFRSLIWRITINTSKPKLFYDPKKSCPTNNGPAVMMFGDVNGLRRWICILLTFLRNHWRLSCIFARTILNNYAIKNDKSWCMHSYCLFYYRFKRHPKNYQQLC